LGVPTALSILRLWVESGGELQTTLLLVANVSPLNLGAALFATVSPLVTVVLVVLFATGAVLRTAVDSAAEHSRLRMFPPVIARVREAAPPWFVGAIFVLAALTWPIYSLTLLIPAVIAATQRPPWHIHDRWPVGLGLCLAVLATYFWLVGPAVREAWYGNERVIAMLLATPPLVAFGVAGSLPAWLARIFSTAAAASILALTAVATWSLFQTPVLPLVVMEVRAGTETTYLRGHVVSVDDVHLVLLQEHGGVRYIPIREIYTRVLCSTPQEIPAFVTRVRDYHVEDSLLMALGRHVRPRGPIDPLCRITPART
jgi:hypothetical protein